MTRSKDIPGVITTATKTTRRLIRVTCMVAGRLNGNDQELVIENKICHLDYMLVATKYVRAVA